MSDWAGSVAQVLDPHGAPAGAGFLVAESILVTCAHVVEDAGGEVGDPIQLRFPHAAGAPETTGRVLAEGWQPPEDEDIALIGLDRMPDGLSPLPLARSEGCRGHRVRSFGFPEQAGHDGHFGYGQAGDLLQPSLLQLTDANDLTEGFSGGPVWDDTVDAVIGMVTAVTQPDRLARGAGIGYATSTTAVRAAWPGITVATSCPYRGIESFDTEHAGLFHGRDRAVRNVLDALADRPALLLLLGPSGAGKSSLIRAGVLPKLKAGQLPGSKQWSIEVVRPGPELPGGLDLLVVDQFEEMLTEPGAAATLTGRITAIGRPGHTVLLVMRDDFYARLAAEAPDLLAPPRPGQPKPGIINIPAALDRDELHDIIVAPAKTARARLQDGLAERIIDDVLDGGSRAATTVLPLLQVALKQLWENQDDGVLTRQAYDGFGGLSGSITSWCDQVISRVPKRATRTMLTMLVRPADSEHNIPAVRRQRRLSDLHEAVGDGGKALAKLVAGRVVVTSAPESAGEPVADLAHDALIDRWYTLRSWVEQDTDYQKWLHRAEEKQRQWADRSDPDDLLTGRDLTEGQKWFARRRLPYEVAAFLTASQVQAHARARRAQRLKIVVRGLLAVVLVIAGAVVWQWHAAVTAKDAAVSAERLALSRQLAAQSTALLPTDPDVADLLAVQAYRTRPTSEAVDSLHNAVAQPIARTLTGHTSVVSAVAYSPNGEHLASVSYDDTVRVWDLAAGNARTLTTGNARPLTGPVTTMHAVAYSPDGTHLASASSDGTVWVWDLATGNARTLTGHTDIVSAVAYSPNGTHLASASWDGAVRIWDLANGNTRTLTGHNGQVSAVAYSPDGEHLVSAGGDGTVRVWDLATDSVRLLTGHTSTVSAAVYSSDGTHLAIGSDDGAVRVWDLATSGSRTLTGHTREVSSVSYSPDGTHLASASYDGTVRVWDLATGNARTLTGHTSMVHAVAYSPDGTHLASAGGNDDGAVRVWDLATGNARILTTRTLTSHPGAVYAVAYSPDGTHLASASWDGTVRVWELATGDARTVTGPTSTVYAVAYSPDGTHLASDGGDGAVRVWDLATGDASSLTKHPGAVHAVAYSPDGTHLATGGGDVTVRVWDLATGNARALTGHNGQVYAVAYSPDRTHLATASQDSTVRVWDLATGNARTLTGHNGKVSAVAYSPDGTHLATAGQDKAVRVWAGVGMTPPAMVGFICDRLRRDFTPDERMRYLPSADATSPVCPATR